jgi:squalene-associated FAD-dependent desaturase
VDRVEDVPPGALAPVAVIGGGWAGCAAALRLADARVPVVLYESAPVLGGRARCVERDGLMLDNGQHLLLGAYVQTLALLARLRGARTAAPAPWIRRPLTIMPLKRDQVDALTMLARVAPGRLGLLIGLMTAHGLSWRERVANIRWFRQLERQGFVRPLSETVAQLLAPLPFRVARLLWEPLCLAALNTPAAAASAQIFANVLRASFTGDPGASDFVLPATDLTTLLPSAAARHLETHGGQVLVRKRTRVVMARRDDVTLDVESALHTAQAVVVAVGPHQLDDAFAPEALAHHPALAAAVDAMRALRYEPIVTIWLGYSTAVPLPAPIARLDDAPGQWVVDRPDVLHHAENRRGRPPLRQLLAVIISASGPHLALPHATLVAQVDGQLRRLQPAMERCAWSFVIAEKRATYACTPTRVRPGGPRLAPGIYIAGDYVDPDYPATLEAAVRSGLAAADAVLADRARR